jgi:hypothetical protein
MMSEADAVDTQWFHLEDTKPPLPQPAERFRLLLQQRMVALAPARVRPADTFVTLVDDADLIAVIPDRDRPECVLQLRLSATEITGGWAINDIPWDYVDTTGPHALRVDRLAHQDPVAFQKAAAWLEQQLRRPLELRQWCWSDRVVGQELVLGEAG